MTHFTANEIETALQMVPAAKRDFYRGRNQTAGIYIREDGTAFCHDSHPKSIGSKLKANVVAVVHPRNGWCG